MGYDYYSQYIYQWLTDTFFVQWQEKTASILVKLDNILTVLQNGLYLGVFVFFFWVLYTIVKPHLFKV